MLQKLAAPLGTLSSLRRGTTLKVMSAPNVYGKPFYVLSHQSGNLLTTPLMDGRSCKGAGYDFYHQLLQIKY
jgi:hypothetical protein